MNPTLTIPQAFGRRVTILEDEIHEQEQQTAGGIVLPTSTAKAARGNRGVVLNAGHKDLEHLVGAHISWADLGTVNLHGYDRIVVVHEDAIVAVFQAEDE